MMRGQIAGDLAKDFTVVAPGICAAMARARRPPTATTTRSIPGAAMGRDAIALMAHFGFERFDVAGHDRGGRVAYRLALDHPQPRRPDPRHHPDRRFGPAPTRAKVADTNWSFLNQAWNAEQRHPGQSPAVLPRLFRSIPKTFAEAYADYLRGLPAPGPQIHAMCEDYRKGGRRCTTGCSTRRTRPRPQDRMPCAGALGRQRALPAWYDTGLAGLERMGRRPQGHAIDFQATSVEQCSPRKCLPPYADSTPRPLDSHAAPPAALPGRSIVRLAPSARSRRISDAWPPHRTEVTTSRGSSPARIPRADRRCWALKPRWAACA